MTDLRIDDPTRRLANFRDLGGLPVSGGRRIRPGRLLRSDASYPGDGPPEGAAGWPPAVVIDLRSPEERRRPHVWPAETTVHEYPLLAALAPALREADRSGGYHGLYLEMLQQKPDRFVEIVDLVARAPGPVLVHCALGRDRTGVVIAIVLLACGVAPETIRADYLATEPNLLRVFARMRGLGFSVPTDDELPQHALTVDPGAVDGVIAALQAEPDGVTGWLLRNGLHQDELDRLRATLVE